jgi:hypothetical protein
MVNASRVLAEIERRAREMGLIDGSGSPVKAMPEVSVVTPEIRQPYKDPEDDLSDIVDRDPGEEG